MTKIYIATSCTEAEWDDFKSDPEGHIRVVDQAYANIVAVGFNRSSVIEKAKSTILQGLIDDRELEEVSVHDYEEKPVRVLPNADYRFWEFIGPLASFVVKEHEL